MKHESLGIWLKFSLSILLALVLSILPLSAALNWWQPAWLLLALIFWIFAEPTRVGLFTIWLLGLYFDLLTESPLGQHAIPLLLVGYLLLKFHARLTIFPFARQFLVMFILVLFYYGVQYELAHLTHSFNWSIQLFYPVISTSILWIIVFNLLKSYQHHLKKW